MAQQEGGREPIAEGRQSVRTAAIVPTLNEGRRIVPVLQALSACESVHEIIVVDDGSDMPMTWVQQEFPKVRFYRHEENKGKAAALERGISETDAELLFFCDADLIGFRSEYVTELIDAVQAGGYEMSIGLRGNPAQRAIYLFAMNSGERCVKRSDWESLAPFYKRGFRIETGLNIALWRARKKIFHRQFPYLQTMRERKYGVIKGMTSRVRMSVDVVAAWGYALVSGR